MNVADILTSILGFAGDLAPIVGQAVAAAQANDATAAAQARVDLEAAYARLQAKLDGAAGALAKNDAEVGTELAPPGAGGNG